MKSFRELMQMIEDSSGDSYTDYNQGYETDIVWSTSTKPAKTSPKRSFLREVGEMGSASADGAVPAGTPVTPQGAPTAMATNYQEQVQHLQSLLHGVKDPMHFDSAMSKVYAGNTMTLTQEEVQQLAEAFSNFVMMEPSARQSVMQALSQITPPTTAA